jgi:hypothetical protein
MLKIVALALCLAAPAAFAQGFHPLGPVTPNAYGPGIHSDGTGRAFDYRTQEGRQVPGLTPVKPNAYGLGTGMDAYGRPVRPQQRW